MRKDRWSPEWVTIDKKQDFVHVEHNQVLQLGKLAPGVSTFETHLFSRLSNGCIVHIQRDDMDSRKTWDAWRVLTCPEVPKAENEDEAGHASLAVYAAMNNRFDIVWEEIDGTLWYY
ncbi:hypothetical protein, partial [Erythrobacter sp. YJ-T3-07]|uniref:hypothetical protein n=1 Tax=Erythrobacter sp. YJ-T3-07 TaxID=2793063 RepID=UPI001F412C43